MPGPVRVFGGYHLRRQDHAGTAQVRAALCRQQPQAAYPVRAGSGHHREEHHQQGAWRSGGFRPAGRVSPRRQGGTQRAPHPAAYLGWGAGHLCAGLRQQGPLEKGTGRPVRLRLHRRDQHCRYGVCAGGRHAQRLPAGDPEPRRPAHGRSTPSTSTTPGRCPSGPTIPRRRCWPSWHRTAARRGGCTGSSALGTTRR